MKLRSQLLPFLVRVMAAAVLWIGLTHAAPKTPAIGIITIVSAALASLLLWPPSGTRLRWRRLPRLAIYFLVHSIQGGLDVARRVFSPHLPVRPGFLIHETQLRHETARLLFLWMIGMMPGTASVDLDRSRRITVHVIDTERYDPTDLDALERHIAAVWEDDGAPDPASRVPPEPPRSQ